MQINILFSDTRTMFILHGAYINMADYEYITNQYDNMETV